MQGYRRRNMFRNTGTRSTMLQVLLSTRSGGGGGG